MIFHDDRHSFEEENGFGMDILKISYGGVVFNFSLINMLEIKFYLPILKQLQFEFFI